MSLRCQPIRLLLLLYLLLALPASGSEKTRAETRAEKKARTLYQELLGSASPKEAAERIGALDANHRAATYRVLLEEARRALESGARGRQGSLARFILCGEPTCTPHESRPLPQTPYDDPEAPTSLDGDLRPPERVDAPYPAYPVAARLAKIEGRVVVAARIDAEGEIDVFEVLEALPFGLTEAAVAKMESWDFRPATLDGKPIACFYNLTVNYALKKDG